MGETENNEREEIYSKSVRAGKRTYFFDVKSTKSDELYLTITESKRRFDQEQGKFFYDKHKIFLYKEDFEKFIEGYKQAIKFIETGEKTDEENIVNKEIESVSSNKDTNSDINIFSDVKFEDLETQTSR